MPIKLPENLPAFKILQNEGVMVMSPERADRQDIRPLKIGLLNLMPQKIQTENQFARIIGATPLQIDFQLIKMSDHQAKNTAFAHMEEFYRPFQEILQNGEKYDGIIITGAPIEHLSYENVTYWDELRQIFNWTQTNVHKTLGVCWGAMAMINHFHGVKKHPIPQKAFGCYRHQNLDPLSPYLRGFSDDLVVPVSRHTEIKQAEIDNISSLKTLLGSHEVGPCLVIDNNHRALYIFNHLEYETDTLHQEYERDRQANRPINIPINYYPNDDPSQKPLNRWRSHAHLLYGNWINEIYQSTPYDIAQVGE